MMSRAELIEELLRMYGEHPCCSDWDVENDLQVEFNGLNGRSE